VADTGNAVGAEQCVGLIFVVDAGGPPDGKGGAVPDGVDDDVVDGVEWTEAVATDEEAPREAGGPPELGWGQPRDGVEVEAVDHVQQPPPHGPLVRLSPSLIVVVVLERLKPRERGFVMGGGRVGGCTGRERGQGCRVRVGRRVFGRRRRHLSDPAGGASTPASHRSGDVEAAIGNLGRFRFRLSYRGEAVGAALGYLGMFGIGTMKILSVSMSFQIK